MRNQCPQQATARGHDLEIMSDIQLRCLEGKHRVLSPCAYLLYCLLSVLTAATGDDAAKNGMTVRVFENIPSVLEVGCTGATLGAGIDVLYLTLVTHPSKVRVAFIDHPKKTCTTLASFSACRLDEANSRFSELRTLVLDMTAGETRSFGCVVSYGVGGYARSAEWLLEVRMNGE